MRRIRNSTSIGQSLSLTCTRISMYDWTLGGALSDLIGCKQHPRDALTPWKMETQDKNQCA